MARFIYDAHGIAIGGRITKPEDRCIDSQAACVLPSTGGRAYAQAGPFSLTLKGLFVLSFEFAETRITGEETAPGVHTTTLTTTLRGLNVRDILKADEIVTLIKSVYNMTTKELTIDTEGSKYTNLTVAGENFDVKLEHTLGREAAKYAAFRKAHPDLPKHGGKTYSYLARHPKLKEEGDDHGFHHHDGFGRIYFGEWTAAPKTQRLGMLRLRLGCAVEGNLTGGDGQDSGGPFPP